MKPNYTLRAVERLAQQFNSRSTGIVVVESLFILLIDLTAFLGNLMVLIAVSRNSNLRRTIPNMYIITLALSDFLMSITGISFTMVSVMLGRWPFGHFVCQFYGFWVLVMCAVSLQSLALTAVNRYYLIARSQVQYRKIFTLKSTKIMIAVLWVMAVFAPLSYVVADHKFFFHPGKAICMHDLESLLRGYGIFLSLYVAVPLFIIVTCYSKVFIAVRKHSLNLHHRQGTESNPARLTVEEIDLTYTLTCVVFGFLICWTPVVTVDTIDFVRCDWLLSRPVYMAYTCFGSTSMAVNPIIYGIRKQGVQEGILQNIIRLSQSASRCLPCGSLQPQSPSQNWSKRKPRSDNKFEPGRTAIKQATCFITLRTEITEKTV